MTCSNIYCCTLIVLTICLIIRTLYVGEAVNEGYIPLLGMYISTSYWWPTRLGLNLTLFSTDTDRKTLHSSVWCLADADAHKICTFKNLCYVPLERQFIFVLTNDSVLSGIDTISELKSLELSSILNHNQFTMNIATVLPGHKVLNRRLVRERSAYVLWRFKSDNIMHVIHDDLLPLYATYSNLCSGDVESCVSKFRLAFLDGGDGGSHLIEWYKLFSNSEPLVLQRQGMDTITCFEEVRTGLVRSTTWFQYGFGVPQGPIDNTRLSGNTIRGFTKFVAERFRSVQPLPKRAGPTAVLFNRRINRRILNEDSVLDVIAGTYRSTFPERPKLEIIVLDLSTNDTGSILGALSRSDVVVGMHGAMMILSMFLPPGSLVVELFPFAIVPEHVSPLRALSRVPGVDLRYEPWRNTQRNNSRPRPDALPIYGGIAHLTEEEQNQVKSLNPIPAMVCCHNPAYLYRMFQDTIIDSSFKPTLQRGLERLKHQRTVRPDYFTSRWWYPASVTNATCDTTPTSLDIKWNPSVNVEGTKSWYEVTVVGSGLELEFVSAKTSLRIARPANSVGTADVWIRCVAAGEESVDVHVRCSAS